MPPLNPQPSRRGRRAVAAMALLLGALALGPPAHAAPTPGVPLRVMAYNIQAGAGADHVWVR